MAISKCSAHSSIQADSKVVRSRWPSGTDRLHSEDASELLLWLCAIDDNSKNIVLILLIVLLLLLLHTIIRSIPINSTTGTSGSVQEKR